MTKCFYSINGIETIGPVGIEELRELHRDAKIPDFALYSQEDRFTPNSYPSWFPASSLAEPKNSKSDAPSDNQLDILRKYLGAAVAANTADPSKFEAARLVFVGADYFSLRPVSSTLPIHYPTHSILSLREWPTAIPYTLRRPVDLTLKQGAISRLFTGDIQDRPAEFENVQLMAPLVIEIFHNVSNTRRSGVGVGVGVAIPIG
jgi:hypothetical protein